MKYIVLIVIAVLALLALPVIAHQAPPVVVNGLAVESLCMAVAIDTDCFVLRIEQSTLEKVILESNRRLSENSLTHCTLYESTNLKSTGAVIRYSCVWLDNVGYRSQV